MLKTTPRNIESGSPKRHNGDDGNQAGKGLAATYLHRVIGTYPSSSPGRLRRFTDRFQIILPHAETKRIGITKEEMLCASFINRYEGQSKGYEIADCMNNRNTVHYCDFNMLKSLLSQWIFTRFIRKAKDSALKSITIEPVQQL